MALVHRPDCTSVLIADERASRTIGVATLKGRFLSRVQRAFLTQLQTDSHAHGHGHGHGRAKSARRLKASTSQKVLVP
jgi:hypothetical protein